MNAYQWRLVTFCIVKVVELDTYCTEGVAQVCGEEEAALVQWVTIRVQTNHQSGGDYGWNNAYEHDEASIVPSVAEPAHCQDNDGSNNTARDIKDELLSMSAKTYTRRIWSYRLLRSVAKRRQ